MESDYEKDEESVYQEEPRALGDSDTDLTGEVDPSGEPSRCDESTDELVAGGAQS